MVSDREINPRKKKNVGLFKMKTIRHRQRGHFEKELCVRACVRFASHVTYSLKNWIFHSMPTLYFFLLLFVNLMHRKFNANGTSKICFSYKLTLMMMKMKKPLCHPNANVTVQNEYEVKKKQQNV